MTNGLTPTYLSDIVPQSLSTIHDHNTRHADVIPPIRTRTTQFSNYFLPSTVRSWNLQPHVVKHSTSINSLKLYFKSKVPKKPLYYYTGTRIGQIMHCRLRMQCSSLNAHLFSKNIIESPNCTCGNNIPETTSHYLFYCPRFREMRSRHIDTLDIPLPLTLDILLYGSPELTLEQNFDIFVSVQNFILNSKRFKD